MHYRQLKIVALLAWVAAVAAWDVSAPSHLARGSGPAGSVNYQQLATKLSKAAHIYLPGSDAFDSAVARWSNLSTPLANVVVVPGTEHDIIETVRLLSNSIQPNPTQSPIVSGNNLLIFSPLRSNSQTSTRCLFSPPMAFMDQSPRWEK